MSRILVTGACGYIGCHVINHLLNNGFDVVAADIKNINIDSRAKFLPIDLFAENQNVFTMSECPDICLHLAWQDGFNHNAESHLNNLHRHYNFIKKMVDSGLKQVVIMGTMHEIGYYEGCVDENTICNPLSLYGISKDTLRRSMELYFHDKEVVFQWLRAFYILGDDCKNKSIFTKIATMEKAGQCTFPFTDGENKYDFLDIEELAEQIAIVCSQKEVGGIINCCSGIAIPLKDKIEEFIDKNKFKIRPEYGAFPKRKYDSPAIWGNDNKIKKIMGSL